MKPPKDPVLLEINLNQAFKGVEPPCIFTKPAIHPHPQGGAFWQTSSKDSPQTTSTCLKGYSPLCPQAHHSSQPRRRYILTRFVKIASATNYIPQYNLCHKNKGFHDVDVLKIPLSYSLYDVYVRCYNVHQGKKQTVPSVPQRGIRGSDTYSIIPLSSGKVSMMIPHPAPSSSSLPLKP